MLNKYFFEIRNRVTLVIVSWILTIIFAYLNKETLLFLSVKPNIGSFDKTSFYFISTNVTDVFSVYLSFAYFVSFQLTFIYLLYNVYMFFIPALYNKERKNLSFFLKLSFSLWLLSLLILNKLVLPLCWEFFSSFQSSSTNSVNIFLEIRITEFFSLYVLTYYVTTCAVQCFVILFSAISILKKKLVFIRATRKVFHLAFFVLATLITPPDVISQLVLGSIFILIYELVIIIIILKDF
jgi:sec-independent protein translocase protein TatC